MPVPPPPPLVPAAACVTLTVCGLTPEPEIVIVPDREEVEPLAVVLMVNEPLLLPEVGEAVSQLPSVEETDQLIFEVTLTLNVLADEFGDHED